MWLPWTNLNGDYASDALAHRLVVSEFPLEPTLTIKLAMLFF